MTILFRPQGAFGWFSYTTSRDTIAQIYVEARLAGDRGSPGDTSMKP